MAQPSPKIRDEVRVLIALGGNLGAAAPDSKRTEAALQRCQLTVDISTKLNHSHLITGKQDALNLPTLGRTEHDIQSSGPQFVTVDTRKVSGFRLVSYNIPRGNLAAYYPETNPLVPLSSVGDETFTPTSKSVPVVITRSQRDTETERRIA